MLAKAYKNILFLLSMAGNYRPSLHVFRRLKRRYPHYALLDADICIEGFPRSGNTFIVAALQRWNPDIHISHHSHLASNAKFAIDHGIPTIILIREPLEAVSSAMIWDGKLSASIGLRSYQNFYSSLLSLRPNFLVMDFIEFTQFPDRAVQKINKKFDIELAWRDYNQAERQALRRHLKKHDTRTKRKLANSSLPNAEKEHLKLVCRNELSQSRNLGSAKEIYEKVVEWAQ